MKVAYLTDTYLPHNNGVATSLYATHHAKKGWHDEIFAPVRHPDVHRIAGLPFALFPEYKLAHDTGRLAKRLDGFDVLHIHTPYGMFYYAFTLSRELGKPLIGTFHTDPAAVFGALLPTDSLIGRPATRATWKYLIKSYNRCDTVIAVSGWLERELRSRKMKAPIEVIPNGVDIGKFRPDVDDSEFREKYGIGDRQVVLFLGRLQHKKGPETFVRAALECDSDAVFFVSGKGELESHLKKMAAKGEKDFVFSGHIPDHLVPQAYWAADLFVLPSQMETQGVVLLEALASETPCICTDVGIAREVLPTECIMGQKDHKGLAEKIDWLLDDDKTRAKYGRDGRRLVEDEYSITAMCEKLADLYGRVSKD